MSLNAKLFLILVFLVGSATGFFIYFSGERRFFNGDSSALSEVSPAAPAPPVSVEPPTPRQAPVSPPAQPVGALWKFQGRVLDIARLTAIEGVTVTFMEGATVVTGGDGGFSAEVPSRPGGAGYFVELSHPDFGNIYWERDWADVPLEDRLAVRGQMPSHNSFRGNQDNVVTLDFGMFPQVVSEEEEKEWRKALEPTAGD